MLCIATNEKHNNKDQAGGGELQTLYGWSVDITIAAAAGYTVEFGEIYAPPNSGAFAMRSPNINQLQF